MQITESVCNNIIHACLSMPLETGGILGGKNNIITEFVFDKGTPLSSKQHYYPDISKLNDCIENWQNDGIEFYGIVHSHLQDEKLLSLGDRQYIQAIMLAMPMHIRFLYFPIVLPQKEMVSFKAMRFKNEVKIVKSNIKIISREVG